MYSKTLVNQHFSAKGTVKNYNSLTKKILKI